MNKLYEPSGPYMALDDASKILPLHPIKSFVSEQVLASYSRDMSGIPATFFKGLSSSSFGINSFLRAAAGAGFGSSAAYNFEYILLVKYPKTTKATANIAKSVTVNMCTCASDIILSNFLLNN